MHSKCMFRFLFLLKLHASLQMTEEHILTIEIWALGTNRRAQPCTFAAEVSPIIAPAKLWFLATAVSS